MEGSEGSSHLFVGTEAAGDPMSLLGFPLIYSDLAQTGEKLSGSDHSLVSYEPKLHDSSGKRRTIPVYKGSVTSEERTSRMRTDPGSRRPKRAFRSVGRSDNPSDVMRITFRCFIWISYRKI